MILRFAQLDPKVWAEVRAELLATALVKVEDEVTASGKPFLRFHPTLPYAASAEDVAYKERASRRFVGVYQEFAIAVDKALQGGTDLWVARNRPRRRQSSAGNGARL